MRRKLGQSCNRVRTGFGGIVSDVRDIGSLLKLVAATSIIMILISAKAVVY